MNNIINKNYEQLPLNTRTLFLEEAIALENPSPIARITLQDLHTPKFKLIFAVGGAALYPIVLIAKSLVGAVNLCVDHEEVRGVHEILNEWLGEIASFYRGLLRQNQEG